MLSNNTREQTTFMCNNIDKFQKLIFNEINKYFYFYKILEGKIIFTGSRSLIA